MGALWVQVGRGNDGGEREDQSGWLTDEAKAQKGPGAEIELLTPQRDQPENSRERARNREVWSKIDAYQQRASDGRW